MSAKISFLSALFLASYAMAETPIDGVQACVKNAIETKSNPALCVDQAHEDCLTTPEDTPAVATLCFKEAHDQWTTAISTKMEAIKTNAPEEIATIAAIELKYDLLSSLLQCDRMEELSLISSKADEAKILLQKHRCTATAAGLAYTRLLWRSEGIK